jgi:electron transfer flavoprotein beta subunit
MKILVCISSVPDTTSKINFTDNNTKFDTNGIQFVINPNDEFGLTKAMMLKEAGGAEVVVAHVGTASSDPILRKALAIGADKALRFDAEAQDAWFVAQQLKQHVDGTAYDLIICGNESIDYNGGQVPAMLSALTGMPVVQNCIGLEIEGSNAKASREIDGGKENLTANLPLIVGGKKGLVEESDLRIPNMRGIMMARSKPLEVIPAAEVNAAVGHEQFEKPAGRGDVKLFDAEDVNGLVQALHNDAKVI